MVLALTPTTFDACVAQAVNTLAQGGIFVFPTETVYGIGCDASNAEAVTKLLTYKGRPAGRSVPVVVTSKEMAESVVSLTPTAQRLYETFLPGPLTVVSKSLHRVDPRLESELGSLGVRISSHEFIQAVVAAFGKPIAATSAAIAGGARIYSVEHLRDPQKSLVDLIIDGGILPPTPPSSVIDTTQDAQELLRAGADPSQYGATVTTTSEAETMALAMRLLEERAEELAHSPLVFALEGEMGAGKTHFAKGLAQALQVSEVVTSPTYTLVKEYEGVCNGVKTAFIHLDLWRTPLATPEELGLDEHLKPNAVVALEWAAPLLSYLAEKKLPGYKLLFTGEDEQRSIAIARL